MNKQALDLQIKSFDQDQGVFVGIASTPAPDREKDIVEPKGAVFSLPLPLLAYHDHQKVIGTVEQATITESGIEVVCRVLKDITQEAKEIWGLIQAKAMKGLSIGFRPLDTPEALPGGGYRFKKYELLELSVVPVAMNGQASITATKSATNNAPKENSTMTIAEQIQQYNLQKSAAVAKMDGLISKGLLQGDDATAYEAAEAELAQIDKHLDRLKAAEARQAQTAAPISAKGLPVNVQVNDNAPKGTDFVRYCKSLALSKGNIVQALEIAKGQKYSDRVQNVLKAAVSAGTTDAVGYSALVEHTTMTGEFIELLQPATITGRLSQLRRVPMNVRIPKQTGATSAQWVGESMASPLTNLAVSDMTVEFHKVSAIVALSQELLRLSDPNADMLVRGDLIKAAANVVDTAFADVANSGTLGVKPASVFNGTANTAATTGTTAAAVRVDVAKVFGYALAANQPLDGAAWLMHPATALQLSMMRHATSGQPEFPGITMEGGTFFGLPVITSTNVPGNATIGYPVSLIVQPEILIAEDGISVEASTEASLQMDSAPTNDGKTPTATSLVSLWQNGLAAVKLTRPITWKPRRPSAVAQITACKYAA